jgi:hypothetical protein
VVPQVPSRTRYAEHLVSEEPFNEKKGLDIVGPVAPLPTGCPLGIKEFCKLLFPIPEGMNLNSGYNAR